MGKTILITSVFCSYLMSASMYETIFDGNCGSCHTVNDASSAPLIQNVIKKYKEKYPTKKEFAKALSSWVYSPNKENSLFLEAIKRYSLMPELGIDKETLQGIATYLYDRKNER